jgi:hypothetical protein
MSKGKGKGRVVPVHAMKVYMSSSIAPPILNLCTRQRWPVGNPDMEVKPSETEQCRSVYPSARPARQVGTATGSQWSTSSFDHFSPVPLNSRLGGLHGQYGHFEEKTSYSLRQSNPRSSSHHQMMLRCRSKFVGNSYEECFPKRGTECSRRGGVVGCYATTTFSLCSARFRVLTL